MSAEELDDRIDDILTMGHTRAKAHIKALYLDLIGDDELTMENANDVPGNLPLVIRDQLRAEFRAQVGDA